MYELIVRKNRVHTKVTAIRQTVTKMKIGKIMATTTCIVLAAAAGPSSAKTDPKVRFDTEIDQSIDENGERDAVQYLSNRATETPSTITTTGSVTRESSSETKDVSDNATKTENKGAKKTEEKWRRKIATVNTKILELEEELGKTPDPTEITVETVERSTTYYSFKESRGNMSGIYYRYNKYRKTAKINITMMGGQPVHEEVESCSRKHIGTKDAWSEGEVSTQEKQLVSGC